MRLVSLFLLSLYCVFAQPSQIGQWTALQTWPFIPVSVAHLSDGRLIAWASTQPTTFPAGNPFSYAAVYDPSTGLITSLNNTAHDMFCAGLASTGDGRIIASGGGADVRTTSTFSITTRRPQAWSRLNDMLAGRWYNSSITLPTGNLMTMWGRSGGTLTETFNQNTNAWSALSGISLLSTSDPNDLVDDDNQWFPHLHLMPNGKILMAGPLRTMRWLDYTGTGSAQDIGTRTPDGDRHRKLGASIQYLPGKILFVGGRDDRYSPSVTNTGVLIDATSGTPVTTAAAAMNYARAFHNLVVMPNGEVMVLGGNTSGIKFSDTGGVTVPEIWNPNTNQWRTTAPLATPRGYHLTAILLRDGRVMIGGGGLCGCAADHANTQIFSPPYLFNADGSAATRPTIELTPSDVKPGLTVGLKGSDNISGFRLIRLQATTHGINSDQRYIPVNFTKPAAGNYNLTLDANQSVLPPGMYWLFAVNAAGTPSVGYPVQVHVPATYPGGAAGETNLAKGKAATQSSTDLGAGAERAVDDNTSGDFALNSVSHTLFQPQPYWQVDLGAPAFLNTVRIWNRTDCCAARLTNFYVFTSNQPITGTTIAQVQAQPGVNGVYYPTQVGTSIDIPVGRSARYVRIQVEGSAILHLAEVEAIGYVITNAAPAIAFTAPAPGATATAPATFNFAVNATDVDNNLSRVEFYQGSTKIGEDTVAPYTFSWNSVPVGNYTVLARAIDSAGLSAEATLNVVVNAPIPTNVAPVISIAQPVNGTTFPAPASFSIDINASDPDNNLARVELFAGAVKISEATAPPFAFAVTDLAPGTYSYTARATDTQGLTASTPVTIRVLSRQLQSLKGVPVPEPSTLLAFVKNRSAAIALGKALFWDTQLSSDGNIACASCHFHAGADLRIKNQGNPGTFRTGSPALTFDTSRTGSAQGPNYTLKRGDFPTHVLSNPADPNSTVVYQSKDVIGSHGVLLANFTSADPGASQDACASVADPVFGAFRRSTGRNSPAVINAVFNVRNFWDGRANPNFNGVDSFGPRNSAAVIYRGTPPVPISVNLDNASLASQAVSPALSPGEMACNGRTWPEVGRRLLAAVPLARQSVLGTDSVLGTYSATPAKGLTSNYAAMVQAAFFDDLHASAAPITIGGKTYSQAQANFSLFFGLAVQLYQSALVSDQAPIDNYFAPYPATTVANASALTADAVAGMNVFNGKGRCVTCHHGPQLTNAATPSREAAAIGALVSYMRTRSFDPGAYDLGFYNLGVRPTGEDLGLGASDPFGNPLSYTRQVKSNVRKDFFSTDACTFEIDPCIPLNSSTRDVVDGAFKTPTLRNISLTGPYFHNGSAATLEEVVEFYNRGGNARGTSSVDDTGFGVNTSNAHVDIRPLALTEGEKSSLIAFMKTALIDDRVLYERAPFDHPELPLVNSADTMIIPAVGAAGRALPLPTFEDVLNSGDLGYPVVATVALSVPATSFTAPATIALTATTTGTVAQVEFLNGATLLGTDTAAPYSFSWANVPAGTYTVTARVNGTTTSAPITITVSASPTVTLSAPASTFTAPATIALTATTTGTVTQVEFFNGATLLGTDTSAPYSFDWTNVPVGSYTLTAKINGTTTSAPVAITVTATPTVTLSVPATTFTAPATIALTAATTGTITQVEFFNGATLLGTDTTAPYSFSWASVPAGAYTLTAKINGTTTSAPIAITVDAAPTVALSVPATSFIAPATIALTATTTGTITQVEFFNGAALLNTDTVAPFAFSWANVPVGAYTLTARINGSTTSSPISINVTAPATPTVVLSAPASTFPAPASIALTATTTGTVTQVEFFSGTTLLSTDSSAPYAFTWTNVSAGAYSLTARINGAIISAPISITVSAPPAGPTPSGSWPFDSVGANTTPDISGNNNPGSVTGPYTLVAGKTGQAIQLDPGSGSIRTQRSALDPTKSYTVSVWVKLNSTAGTQTFVSLPANSVSNFYLQLAGWLGGGFCLDVYGADSTSADEAFAYSATPPVANRWYHLTGVFDATAGNIRLYVDGVLASQVAAPATTFANTTPLALGYSIYASTRHDGNDAQLDDLRVFPSALTAADILTIFNGDGAPATPTVSLSAPAAAFTAPATIALTATTTGAVTQVEFFINGATLLGTDSTAPYEFAWTNVPAGTYTVTARVNGATTSAPITLTVSASPTVTLSAPATTFTAPATIALTAATTGTITQVEFFNGVTLLGTDTAAPYTFSWANVPVGTYTVTARINGVTTSAPITLTVSATPTVTVSAPATTFAAPATIALTAATTGTVTQVEFFNGATLLGTDSTAPYEFAWSNVPVGTYTVTARINGITTSAPITLTVSASPTVTLSAPATTFTAPATIALTAATTGTITQVEFFNGATLLGTDTVAPYTFSWANVPVGTYTVTARINGVTTSAPVTLTVSASPTVTLSAPATTFTAPATIALTAATTGTITQVEFFNGATLLGTDTAAPYTFSWSNVPVGTYTVTARINGVTTSAPITLTVSATPTVTLSAPATTFTAPATIALTATTTGTITQVEFFNGATLLGTDTVAPYTFSWANVPAGVYTLTARINGSTTSTPLSLTVTAPAVPTVTLSAPATTFTAPATIALTATTTGAITQVEFFNGATLLGTDTTSPYAFSWANVPAGAYTVTARINGSTTSTPLSLTVTATPTGPTPSGRWPFDSVATNVTPDTSGNNNPATVTGPYNLAAATIGQGIQLDPNTGGIRTQRSALDPTKSFTVSVWVKLNTTSGTQTFVSLPANSVSNFYLQTAGWLNGGFCLDMYGADSASATEGFAYVSAPPVANRWYHLTGVYDATARQLRLYVDGQLANQAAAPATTFANTAPLALGYSIYDGTRHDGNDARLDDLQVFPSALTAAQILTLYNSR